MCLDPPGPCAKPQRQAAAPCACSTTESLRSRNSCRPSEVLLAMGTARDELKSFRAEKDHVFAHDADSPLTADQRHTFKGLVYFEENPRLVIRASIDRNVEPGEVRMSTSTGEEQVYQRYGVV